MTRREKLLLNLDLRTLRGIEIGPLASPVVDKRDSEVLYVDHADEESLKIKYATDPNVDVEKIVVVDATWGKRTLREALWDRGMFDYVIASHVLEHVPDMLGWLTEIAEVLRPGGQLSLAIPDKRFTFDYLRQPSRLNEVLDAYLRHNRQPTPGQIFDYNANAVELDMVAAWEGKVDESSLRHYANLRCALDRSIESVRDKKYIDSHCWVFTTESLLSLLVDLVELDLLPYRCIYFYEPERYSNEMVLIMKRHSEDTPLSKATTRVTFISQMKRLGYSQGVYSDGESRSATEKVEFIRQQQQETNKMIGSLEQRIASAYHQLDLLETNLHLVQSRRSFRDEHELKA
jgi:SAM-dependent methyltransferase